MALNPLSDAGYALQQIKERALNIQTNADNQGVLRDSERKPGLKGLGLDYGFMDIKQDPRALIKNARQNLNVGSQEMLRQNQGIVVKTELTQLPNGQVGYRFNPVGLGHEGHEKKPAVGSPVTVQPTKAGK